MGLVLGPNLHGSGRIFNFYGNKEIKIQLYLQAKFMSYIPMPQANHHDMQIYQGLVMTEENLHKEELELADENNSMIKGVERD